MLFHFYNNKNFMNKNNFPSGLKSVPLVTKDYAGITNISKTVITQYYSTKFIRFPLKLSKRNAILIRKLFKILVSQKCLEKSSICQAQKNEFKNVT